MQVATPIVRSEVDSVDTFTVRSTQEAIESGSIAAAFGTAASTAFRVQVAARAENLHAVAVIERPAIRPVPLIVRHFVVGTAASVAYAVAAEIANPVVRIRYKAIQQTITRNRELRLGRRCRLSAFGERSDPVGGRANGSP